MRFAVRAFAYCFIPFALLFGISFLSLQLMIQRTVRDQLRSGLRQTQGSMAEMRARNEVEASRLLRLAGENLSLKAGMQLLNADPSNEDARRQVEDQLRELSGQTGLKLLSVANCQHVPVAWVMRGKQRAQVPEVAPALATHELSGYAGRLYRPISTPIYQAGKNLGSLSMGDEFDLAEFGVPAVLLKDSRILRTGHIDAPIEQLAAAMAACGDSPECEVKINGTDYLSIRLEDAALGGGYVLRSLQNVDAAAAPMQGPLQGVFLTASMWAALAAFMVSAGASRSMLRPLTDIIAHLRQSETAGLLEKLPSDQTRIVEVRELIGSFNRAASAIQDARNGLQSACFEFVGSLAHALDARDRYTAGHSQRVSQIAMSVVSAMDVTAEEEEVVRIGALLHDIGKIGVPDYVLQKPGALTDAEFALIKQHPTIGCRILEGVQGFSPYLPVVELHHENWDGTGYPYGLSGKAVPLPARIVHVADAWDAMTSDRPYRRGFSHERALAIIRANAGTQFDPEIAAVFCRLMQSAPDEAESILRLSAAVEPQPAPATVEASHWENA